jgi:hypothetical protein
MSKNPTTAATAAVASIAPVVQDQVSDAPGRGMMPNVSPHTAAAP